MKIFVKITSILMLFCAFAFTACGNNGGGGGGSGAGDSIVNIAAIPGVVVPVIGATPVTTAIDTDQYTGTITWNPADSPFAASTVYTASIVLTEKTGFTLTGVAENFFTVAGATTVTSTVDTGVVTAVFPATTPPAAGANLTYTLPSISFNMKYAPGGTFPTGTNDSDGNQTISTPFWMAETEVTYVLWKKVYDWATSGIVGTGAGLYTFSNQGREGNDGIIGAAATNQEPVTTINWRDSMVWCNALTEYYNANNGTDTDLDCVYYINSDNTTPIRAATASVTITWELGAGSNDGKEDDPYVKATAKGFRLPGSMEWECAARYKDGSAWTAGSMASGGTVAFTGTAATDYPNFSPFAWYGNSTVSPNGNTTTTQPVAIKTENALGIRDMSGNVWEWCFDWYTAGSSRVRRGGSFKDDAGYLRVGGVNASTPYFVYYGLGFRFVRTQ